MDADAVAARFGSSTPVRIAAGFLVVLSVRVGLAWLVAILTLGFVAAGVCLVTGGLFTLTFALRTWLATTQWGAAPDPALPGYALCGIAAIAVAAWYLSALDVPAHIRTASGPPRLASAKTGGAH